MTSIQTIRTKIADLKARIENDSISPLHLGTILDEMIGECDKLDDKIDQETTARINAIAKEAQARINAIAEEAAARKAAIAGIKHPVEIADAPSADLIIADEDANPIATFAGGHIRTANFDSANIAASGASGSGKELTLPGKWCALGTSITAWDATRVDGIKGYQYWVKKRVSFAGGYVNKGVNGYQMASLAANLSLVVQADYYTLEFGTNEMLGGAAPGTLADYTGSTGVQTFAGAMRVVIDRIYQVNPDALIILCTPRKFHDAQYGIPAWHSANQYGIKLTDFVNIIREIAQYESFPVADFFALSNTNSHNLAALSNDDATHPNTAGHRLMASVLCEQFRLLHNYNS